MFSYATVKTQQRKHLLAAHNIVHKEAEQVITNYPTSAKVQESKAESARSPKPGRTTPIKTSRTGKLNSLLHLVVTFGNM